MKTNTGTNVAENTNTQTNTERKRVRQMEKERNWDYIMEASPASQANRGSPQTLKRMSQGCGENENKI